MEHEYLQYIGGELVKGEGSQFDVTCPGNDEIVGTVFAVNEVQTEAALEAAHAAFPAWSALTVEEREVWIEKLIDVIKEEEEELIRLCQLETGKMRPHADFEPGQIYRYLRFFIDQAKSEHSEGIRDMSGGKGAFYAVRQPLGVVANILAWNFPLHNLATKIGPILASGCTAVIKPATKTPLSALYLGELMARIGFPAGVVNIVAGPAAVVGKVFCESTIPKMITMIGSTKSGLKLVKDSVSSIKRFSLELGGNAPVIVTSSADIKAAAAKTMFDKICDAGQTCVSPQRAIIHESVYDEFVSECVRIANNATLGYVDADADMDPMTDHASVERMQALVDDAKRKGATVLCGGKKPADKNKGSWFLPTVIEGATSDMRVIQEEVFGPILMVMPFRTISEAIEMANDTEYGLSSYVWGTDINEISKISKGLEFGIVNVNSPPTNASLPHGGVKNSGIGKDGSRFSLEEYYYIKGIRVSLQQ